MNKEDVLALIDVFRMQTAYAPPEVSSAKLARTFVELIARPKHRTPPVRPWAAPPRMAEFR